MAGNRRVLFANSIYHLTNDGTVTVIAGQITILQIIFSFGALETGLLTGTALLVTAVFQIIFGAMADRRDPPRFLPIGIVLLGLGSAAVALSANFWMLLALVALSRIGASFYHPVGISWIGREFRGPELDRSMGFQSAFGDTGVILGMATTSVIAVATGWWVPFVFWGGINLAAVVLGLWLLRGHRSPVADPPVASPDYRTLLKDVRLWLFPLALGGAAFSIFTTFGPLLLHRKYGLDETASEIALALWILVGALAAFFFGRLSGRFGRLRTLTVSYACIAVACLASVPFGDVGIVLALFWTLGSAVFVTYPALFSFVSESSRRGLVGTSFGLIFGVQILGGSLGAFGAGIVADRLRPVADLESTAPFYLLGLLALAGFVYLVAFRRRIEDQRAGGTAALTAL